MPVTPSASSAAVSGAAACQSLAKIAIGCSVTTASRKMIVSAASRMFSAISFGRLLPVRALDQGDHPVDEALARLLGDLDDDPVGQHLGAAGDRAAVAAGLPDDRGRLAGDGRLVDAGDALDDVAVAGDDRRRPRQTTMSPCAQLGAGTGSSR